jgi:hypothetical protein
MDSAQYERITNAVALAVNESEDVVDGMARLLDFCRVESPTDASLWNTIAECDFEGDYRQLCDSFGESLSSDPIPAEYNGFYFGLDGLNMPNGKGIEFGCTKFFDDATDAGGFKWAESCSYYPFELPSAILGQLYGGVVKMATLADFALLIPYVGLAVRDCLRELPISRTLGRSRARGLCWGPHDGDLYRLGTLRPDGLVVNFTTNYE